MKKFLSLVLCLCIAAAGLFGGCAGKENAGSGSDGSDAEVSSSETGPSSAESDSESSSSESSSVPSGELGFEMDETPRSVEVYEQIRLAYSLTNASEAIVWTTADEKVAVVKDGVVTGVGVGETTVTGKIGSFSGSCKISVREATETPVLRVNKTSVESLKMLESFGFEAYLTYKEYALDAEITLTSEDENIVAADGLKITGVGEGYANVKLSALYLGREYSVEVPVLVETNVELIRDKSSVELYLYPRGGGQKKTDVVTVSAYVNKETREDVTVTYASSDASVASVDEKGEITAVGIGRAEVTASAVIGGRTYSTSIEVSVNMYTIDTGKKIVVDWTGKAEDCYIDLTEFEEIDRSAIKSVEYEGKVISESSGGAPVTDGDKLLLSADFVGSLVKNKRYDLNISIGEVYYRFYAVFAFRYEMYLIKGRDRLIANDSTAGPADWTGPLAKSNVAGLGQVYKLLGSSSGDLAYNLDRSIYGFPCISRVDGTIDPNDTEYTWRSVNVYFPSDFTGIFHVRQCHHQIKFDNSLGNTEVFSLTWASGDIFNHDGDTCFYIYDAVTGELVNDGHTVKKTMQAQRWYTLEFDLRHRLWFDQWYEDCYWRIYTDATYYMDAAYAYDDAYRTNVLGR